MNLKACILTKNDCYKAGRTITPRGIMVHSTGANNPNLKRYVGPDDGLLGVNSNGNHWNRSGLAVCVHGFIGKRKDGSVATYQTLPWNHRAWHAGSGSRGSANNSHISFEICEDGLSDGAYFDRVYREAAELCAHLCGKYGLDPLADGVLICHSEGYKRGVASNHSDVMHWFPKFGKSMDSLRGDVKALMTGAGETEQKEEEVTQEAFRTLFAAAMAEHNKNLEAMPVSDWAKVSWDDLVARGIFDGTKPQAALTREQAAAVILRLKGE